MQKLTILNAFSNLSDPRCRAGLRHQKNLYQRILNEGVTKGVGLGKKDEAIALISRLLQKRFGEDSETIKPRLNTLSVEQLELFGESLFDFNCFEDSIDWLNNLN